MQPTSAQSSPARFQALDSWRGICACLVALHHFIPYSHIYNWPFLRHSWLFVDFFFVLSGFVIAANYRERLLQGFGIGRFMLLRFGRLYPLHIATLLPFVITELLFSTLTGEIGHRPPWTGGASIESLITNVLLIHALHVHDYINWNSPSWSICVEFFTYLLFALALLTFRRWIGSVMVATALLAPLALYHLKGHIDVTIEYGLIRCAYGFALGVLTFALWQKLNAWWTRTEFSPIARTAAEILVVVLVYLYVDNTTMTWSLIAPYLFAAAVLLFAFESGGVSAVLLSRPLLKLGMLSYSIYMVHLFIAYRLFKDCMQWLEIHTGLDLVIYDPAFETDLAVGTNLWAGDALYVVYLAVVIGTSFMTYRLVEEPGRDWFRRLARRLYPKRAGAAASA